MTGTRFHHWIRGNIVIPLLALAALVLHGELLARMMHHPGRNKMMGWASKES